MILDIYCEKCTRKLKVSTSTRWMGGKDTGVEFHVEPCKTCMRSAHLEGEIHRDKVLSKAGKLKEATS